MVWNSVKESGNTALTDTNNMVAQMDEAKYTQYDGAVVTGSEVINVIKQHATDDVCIEVNNSASDLFYVHPGFSNLSTAGGAPLADARDKNNVAYISPNAKFTGSLVRNTSTNAILGITFTKN